MKIFNVFGAILVAVSLIPNIIFAIRCRDGFKNNWNNRFVETAEQIGRFGCFAFMVFNVPGTCFGRPSDEAFALYLIVNAVLAAAYCAIWAICFKKAPYFALSRFQSCLQ